VGWAVGLGEGSTDGDGEALGSTDGLGLGEGSGDADGSGVGAGVADGSGAGVAVAPGVGWAVGLVVPGAAVGAAETAGSVAVATGGSVTRGAGANTGSCATTWEAAKTNAPPRRATVRMVTISVPVVRIAPRMTWLRRSQSHECWAPRLRRSSSAASRIRSSRSAVGRGVGSAPSRPRTRVLPPISAVQAAQPLTWAARRAAFAGSSSSSRNASIRAPARAQSRAWLTGGFVTPYT
jgi:hypothetical protein